MHRFAPALICLALVQASDAQAQAQAPAIVTKPSPHGVAATVARLEAAITKRGATIVAKVDHAAAAKAAGLDLKPATVIIFGNPKLGTPLMQSSATAGLDLPMRVLVWQDDAGGVKVGYWLPAVLAQLHGIKDRDAVLKTMAGALDGITTEAVTK